MKKYIFCAALAMLLGALPAQASQIVTSNVPLDSKYYLYIEKLEGMGFIKDMPTGTKPYSRLTMARWIKDIEPDNLPPYLRVYYDEMAAGLTEELNVLRTGDMQISNVKLRQASVNLTYTDMDKNAYAYDKSVNATYQPLSINKNGHRYGDGMNGSASFNVSGSLSKDFALGFTPYLSYDKDQHGEAKIDEAYLKTHLGMWGIEVGRQALEWGGAGHKSAFAMSNNARPQTMLRIGTLKPHEFNNGLLRFLGKADLHVFYSKTDDDRINRAKNFGMAHFQLEKNDIELLGIRADFTPSKNFTFGAERVSMFKSLNSDWLNGKNAYSDDQWNDIGGVDFRLKFPGVQFYGSMYGEDQAGGLPSNHAYSAGLYFPQIAKDGSWDLRLEGAKTTDAWYRHWTLVNGWTYRRDIMGDAMGKDALKYSAELNHYLPNGDRFGLTYVNTDMDRAYKFNPRLQEITLQYAHKMQANLYLDAVASYAKLKNAEFTSNSKSDKLIGVGLRWEY